ncbi:hypothetical protein [Pseudorhodoferax sp.]
MRKFLPFAWIALLALLAGCPDSKVPPDPTRPPMPKAEAGVSRSSP